jgi:mannose-1-phosphate guanylyltransferase
VTLGISPAYPATGFGYIKRDEELREVRGLTCYKSGGFREKPDEIKAVKFVTSGQYSWNAGMFIFKATTALAEFERQQPEMYQQFQALAPHIDTPTFQSELEKMWDDTKRISIDFAIMEGAQDMVVIPVDIGWSDVGSWASLYEVLRLDALGNGIKGKRSEDPIIIDTYDTLLYNNTGRLTVAIGVKDMVIVDMDDVLLLCHKDHAQDVKQVVAHLREIEKEDYL